MIVKLKQAASAVLAAVIVAGLIAAFGGLMYISWYIDHIRIYR